MQLYWIKAEHLKTNFAISSLFRKLPPRSRTWHCRWLNQSLFLSPSSVRVKTTDTGWENATVEIVRNTLKRKIHGHNKSVGECPARVMFNVIVSVIVSVFRNSFNSCTNGVTFRQWHSPKEQLLRSNSATIKNDKPSRYESPAPPPSLLTTRQKRKVLSSLSVQLLVMSWCLMSSDVIWHIRDKLWPMPKHGSIKSTYVRCVRV